MRSTAFHAELWTTSGWSSELSHRDAGFGFVTLHFIEGGKGRCSGDLGAEIGYVGLGIYINDCLQEHSIFSLTIGIRYSARAPVILFRS